MMKNIWLLIALTPFLSPVFAQEGHVERQLTVIMDKYDAVGLAVAVLKDDSVIYTASLGYKDVEKGIPLKKRDVFRIASISKSFAATAIMQQVEKGELSLDDDIGDLIGFQIRNPHFPDKKITLEMILSHRSSLNDKNGYFTLDVLDTVKTPSWRSSFNEYAPGEEYMYCNLNYNLAGAILEKISGERFDKYVKANILNPLGLYGGHWVGGLDSTRFVKLYEYDEENRKFSAAPDAYAPRNKELSQYTFGYSTPIFSPTGGMKISAVDLAKYMGMHMHYGSFKGEQIITSASSHRMQTALTDRNGYGLGLMTSTKMLPDIILQGHTGSAYGLFSAMFFQPDEKFGFVIITNGMDTAKGVDNFRIECIRALYNEVVKR